MNEGKKILAHW